MLTLLIDKIKFGLFAFGMVSLSLSVHAQASVDGYIQEAFKHNIVLQQKNISLAKAELALKTAKSLFLPTVAFQGAYQSADGGRNIPLPLGDLLNPIYGSLNQLSGANKFPMMENQQIDFLPKNFYDAKIRTTLPLINPDLAYNKRISSQQLQMKETEVLIYKRELVKDIKVAYYNYLNALQAVEIYKSSLQLANEGLRVNSKLLDGGKGLPAYVLRAKSEVENINAQLVAAELQVANARMYFNFLLNRNTEDPIDLTNEEQSSLAKVEDFLLNQPGAHDREELKQLDQAIAIHQNLLKMNKQFAVPRLGAFLDLGSQSEGFKFNQQSRYYMVGLQLEIPIFAGNRNTFKIKETALDMKNAELDMSLVTQQLALSKRTAQNNLRSAYQHYQSSIKQLDAASSYQRLIDKGYQAGANSFIETIDARNQLSSAQLFKNISRYKVLSAMAELEREAASYPIN